MATFDDIYNDFSLRWHALHDYIHSVGVGIAEYRKQFRDDIEPAYLEQVDKGFLPLNVPAHLKAPLTSDNVQEVIDAYVEGRTAHLPVTQNALSLVLAHSILESCLIQLAQFSIEKSTDQELSRLYPDKTATLSEVTAGTAFVQQREKLIEKCKKGFTLKNIVDLIVLIGTAKNNAMTTKILKAYNLDFKELEEIDKLRQSVIHDVDFVLTPPLAECLVRMTKFSRCYAHIVANSVENQGYAYLSSEMVAMGSEILVDLNAIYVKDSVPMAKLSTTYVSSATEPL